MSGFVIDDRRVIDNAGSVVASCGSAGTRAGQFTYLVGAVADAAEIDIHHNRVVVANRGPKISRETESRGNWQFEILASVLIKTILYR